MDKIRALMEKCGLKPELAQQICESIEAHAATIRQKYDEEYAARVEAAKSVCVEETEAYKAELARRLQIFCEAKVAQIEQHTAKQAATRNGEATELLAQAKALLEGIPMTGDVGMKAQLDKLNTKLAALSEERSKAIEKANRQTQLCETVLKRNRMVERKLALLERDDSKPAAKTITENRQFKAQPTAVPVSTRRTLAENQQRQVQRPHQDQGGSQITPAQIAATLDDGEPV